MKHKIKVMEDALDAILEVEAYEAPLAPPLVAAVTYLRLRTSQLLRDQQVAEWEQSVKDNPPKRVI